MRAPRALLGLGRRERLRHHLPLPSCLRVLRLAQKTGKQIASHFWPPPPCVKFRGVRAESWAVLSKAQTGLPSAAQSKPALVQRGFWKQPGQHCPVGTMVQVLSVEGPVKLMQKRTSSHSFPQDRRVGPSGKISRAGHRQKRAPSSFVAQCPRDPVIGLKPEEIFCLPPSQE